MAKYLDQTGLARFWDNIKERVAEDSGFYDEITVETGRTSDTDYYLATVPTQDGNGNIITLYLDYDANRNPLEQADYKHTTLTINGNASILYNGSYNHGISISNGTVLDSDSYYGLVDNYPMYIGIKADRSIAEYLMNSTVTPEQMLADGCLNVFNCYFKLMTNGVVVDVSQISINGTQLTATTRNPLMVMGVKANKDIIFLACDGRTAINQGLTYAEAASILTAKGCIDAYNLDGGGSTCMVVRGSKINRNIDGDGTAIRLIKYTLNVKKESDNVAVQEAYGKVGLEKQRIIEQIVPYVNNVKASLVTELGTEIPANADLNDYRAGGKYTVANAAVATTLTNTPITSRGFDLYVLPQGATGRYFTQVVIANPASDGRVYKYTRSVSIDSSYTTITATDWTASAFGADVDTLMNANIMLTIKQATASTFALKNRAIIVYTIGSSEPGIDFLYLNNANMTTVRVVEPSSPSLEPTYAYNSNTGLVTITNNSSNLYLRGMAILSLS